MAVVSGMIESGRLLAIFSGARPKKDAEIFILLIRCPIAAKRSHVNSALRPSFCQADSGV